MKRRGRHTVKHHREAPNVGKIKSAAVNVAAILPPGSKRTRKLSQKAVAARSSKKVAPKFTKSRNPLNMRKGKYSMAKALETLEEGNYANNSS